MRGILRSGQIAQIYDLRDKPSNELIEFDKFQRFLVNNLWKVKNWYFLNGLLNFIEGNGFYGFYSQFSNFWGARLNKVLF